MLRIILTIVFVLLCIAMTVIVLMQEGKSAGLGAISGAKIKAVPWKESWKNLQSSRRS